MCTSSVYMHLQSDFTDSTRHPVCWKFRLYADECLPGDGVWHHQTEYTPSAQNLKISSSKTHPWIPSIFNKFLHLQKKKITNSTTADSDIPVLILMNINVSTLDLDKKWMKVLLICRAHLVWLLNFPSVRVDCYRSQPDLKIAISSVMLPRRHVGQTIGLNN